MASLTNFATLIDVMKKAFSFQNPQAHIMNIDDGCQEKYHKNLTQAKLDKSSVSNNYIIKVCVTWIQCHDLPIASDELRMNPCEWSHGNHGVQ